MPHAATLLCIGAPATVSGLGSCQPSSTPRSTSTTSSPYPSQRCWEGCSPCVAPPIQRSVNPRPRRGRRTLKPTSSARPSDRFRMAAPLHVNCLFGRGQQRSLAEIEAVLHPVGRRGTGVQRREAEVRLTEFDQAHVGGPHLGDVPLTRVWT